MKTKISVVIPTFKRPQLLMRCLRALSAQSIGKDWFEVIVVSDGPDPETTKALQPWLRPGGLHLTLLSTEIKKGPAACRNLGWLTAKYPLIAFTDDDCVPAKDWLRAFAQQELTTTLMAFTGCTSVPLPDQPTDFARNTARLETAEFITANCACTKQCLLRTGGFDERFMLAWREDSDLHFKLLQMNIPVVKVEAARVTHPVRPAKWGTSIKEQKKAIYEALLFRKYPDLYRNKISGKPLWNYYLINLTWLALFYFIFTHQNSMAEVAGLVQLLLLLSFSGKRLRGNSKSVTHILEMLSTSVLIPTLSLYWRIYGAFKYKVLFI